MLDGVGWSELLILLVAALIILGPERLPSAVRWTTDAVRQARDYLSGATAQLREELGPEVEEFRKPLAELQKLRNMTPQSVITDHLLDGDTSIQDAIDMVTELAIPEPIDVFNYGLARPTTPEPVTSDAVSLDKAPTALPPIDLDAT
ncbi:Sec-independent protein translocase protein TatB [Nocardia arizonensis]|uniref:Sec-independent protein translocase protein TatB n=1 Tax=Nocardia arizonensis TaxID=1141647 RepID=UPI0006CF7AD1